MSAPTGGTWRVTFGRDQMADFGTTIWHDGKSVGVYSDAETHGDARADACLISAAKELLASAEAQEAFWAMRVCELGEISPEANALRALNLACIAKATGAAA